MNNCDSLYDTGVREESNLTGINTYKITIVYYLQTVLHSLRHLKFIFSSF